MTNPNKPTVHYDIEIGATFIFLPNSTNDELYLVASVFGINHPKLGKQRITTSVVLDLNIKTGEFETLNTNYKPVQYNIED